MPTESSSNEPPVTLVKAPSATEPAHARIAQLAVSLSAAKDPLAAYRALCAFVQAETPMNGLFVSSYDAASQTRTCEYAFSEDEELDPRTFPVMAYTGSPHSRACATGETVVTHDFQEAMAGKPRFNVGLERDPELPRSSIVVPMKAHGRVLGAMEIQSTFLAAFHSEHIATLELAAHLAAVTLENVESQERERALRDSLEARVAERTRQLATKNRELESFSWTVAHDLRAPLRAMLAHAQDIEERQRGRLDAESLEALRRMAASVHRMGRLIDDLLLFARAAQGPVVRELIDLASVARDVAEELRSREAPRDATITIQENLLIEADPALARVLLSNLLHNAWKYSARKPSTAITVGMRAQDGERVFFVADQGIGFDAAQTDRLFAAFQRLHASEYEGTGIGLATVSRIVERHGGRAWAEGKPGDGATFFFTLAPRPEPQAAPGLRPLASDPS